MKRLFTALAALVLACGADDAGPVGGGGTVASAGSKNTPAGSAGNASGGLSSVMPSSGAGGVGGFSAVPTAGEAGDSASGGMLGSAGRSENPSGGSAGAGSGGVAQGGAGGQSTNGPIKLWLAGDSTVQQCSGTCPCGWGSQLDALFDDRVTVVNRAVGGRSIQTWLYEAAVTDTLGGDGECTLSAETYDKRWRDMLDAAAGMKPGDYLLIQFGINDGDRTCPRHVGIEAFKEYLGVMAQAAKERGAQAIFVTPVSAIACSGSKATATRGAFVDATKAAATKSGVPVLDLHQASIALYDSLGFCPNDDDYTKGELGAFFCNDHTHFEAAGATQIAKLVGQALKDQAPALASYLR